jgi:hypothetical protein
VLFATSSTLPPRRERCAVTTGTALGNFPFTLPHDLVAGQRRLLRELGKPAQRAFLFRYYREACSRNRSGSSDYGLSWGQR